MVFVCEIFHRTFRTIKCYSINNFNLDAESSTDIVATKQVDGQRFFVLKCHVRDG